MGRADPGSNSFGAMMRPVSACRKILLVWLFKVQERPQPHPPTTILLFDMTLLMKFASRLLFGHVVSVPIYRADGVDGPQEMEIN